MKDLMLFWQVTVVTGCTQGGGGHFTVNNAGGWLDSLGSGILVWKIYFGVLQNIDLDNT